jgi:hypothetical protein
MGAYCTMDAQLARVLIHVMTITIPYVLHSPIIQDVPNPTNPHERSLTGLAAISECKKGYVGGRIHPHPKFRVYSRLSARMVPFQCSAESNIFYQKLEISHQSCDVQA